MQTKIPIKHLFCFCVLLFNISTIDAKVTIEELKKLGKTNTIFTPMGSKRAGNSDSTIPAWTGGIKKFPAGYKQGDFHPFPFPEDKIIFTINSNNYKNYKKKLSVGLMGLFKTFPKSFKMNIYTTHRTASYPEYVYDALIENAKHAELVNDGNGFINAKITSPFPIPKNGLEAIQNHSVHYRGKYFVRHYAQASPTVSGDYTLIKIYEKVFLPYADPEVTHENIKKKNIFAYFLQTIQSPSRFICQKISGI